MIYPPIIVDSYKVQLIFDYSSLILQLVRSLGLGMDAVGVADTWKISKKKSNNRIFFSLQPKKLGVVGATPEIL